MRTINGVGCLDRRLVLSGVGMDATAVYCALLAHSDSAGHCCPSYRLLSRLMRCSVNTIRRAVDLLESERMLAAIRPGKGKRGYNRYRILPILGWKSFDSVSVGDTDARKSVSVGDTAKRESVSVGDTKVYCPKTSPLEYPPIATSANDGSLIEQDFWEWCAALPIHGLPVGSARLISPRTRRKGKWVLNRAWNQHEWFRQAQADIFTWYSQAWTHHRDERKRGLGALLEDFVDQAQLASATLARQTHEKRAGNVIRMPKTEEES